MNSDKHDLASTESEGIDQIPATPKRTSLSDFIRNASDEEKERIYTEVMELATKRQNERPRPGAFAVCTSCSHQQRYFDRSTGKAARCRHCGGLLAIPRSQK